MEIINVVAIVLTLVTGVGGAILTAAWLYNKQGGLGAFRNPGRNSTDESMAESQTSLNSEETGSSTSLPDDVEKQPLPDLPYNKEKQVVFVPSMY